MNFKSEDYTDKHFPQATTIIGFTGHRPKGKYSWMYDITGPLSLELARIVRDEILKVHQANPGVLCLTGGALGFDQIAGYAANSLQAHGVRHIVCIPYYNQWGMWSSSSKRYYEAIVNNATGYRYVDITDKLRDKEHMRSHLNYEMARRLLLHRSEHMMTRADRMIAFFDGSRGGTYHAVSRFPALHGATAPTMRITQTANMSAPFEVKTWHWT